MFIFYFMFCNIFFKTTPIKEKEAKRIYSIVVILY